MILFLNILNIENKESYSVIHIKIKKYWWKMSKNILNKYEI